MEEIEVKVGNKSGTRRLKGKYSGELNRCGEQKMTKSKPMINRKLNDWYKYIVEDVSKLIDSKIRKLLLNVKSIPSLKDGKFEQEAEKWWKAQEYQHADRDLKNTEKMS